MKYLAIFIALASCRCTTTQPEPTAPKVQIVADPTDVDAQRYVIAADAWMPLGFVFSSDQLAGFECEPLWYVEDQTGCQITLHVIRDPHTLEKFGSNGYSDGSTRTIWITPDVGSTYEMRRIMAHETGHMILNTRTHTLGGIMGGSSWTMEQPDYDLACESIGICKEP